MADVAILERCHRQLVSCRMTLDATDQALIALLRQDARRPVALLPYFENLDHH